MSVCLSPKLQLSLCWSGSPSLLYHQSPNVLPSLKIRNKRHPMTDTHLWPLPPFSKKPQESCPYLLPPHFSLLLPSRIQPVGVLFSWLTPSALVQRPLIKASLHPRLRSPLTLGLTLQLHLSQLLEASPLLPANPFWCFSSFSGHPFQSPGLIPQPFLDF